MKKKIIGGVAALVVAAAVAFNVNAKMETNQVIPAITVSEIEAMGATEEELVCRCLWIGTGCKANGHSKICAPQGTIKCAYYNSNCG